MIRSLLLDLDGTLINTEKAFAHCYIDILNNKYGAKAIMLDYKAYELEQNGMLILHCQEIGMIPKVPESEVMEQVYSNYTNYFIKAIQEKEAIDNFELLRKLKEQSYILSLVTTCRRFYLDILNEHQNIYHLFDCVIAREDPVNLKPNPEAYYMALNETGIKNSEGLALEDSKRGIDAAIGAGLKTIKVDNLTEIKYDDPRVIQEHSANQVLRKIYEEKKYIK